MITVESYSMAVAMCVVTMLCWGSWANTQKLATQEWRFQLFYWDYAIGVFLLALLLAFTLGSSGSGGGKGTKLPFKIQGTASDPKFIPDVGGVASGMLGSLAGNLTKGQKGKPGLADALGGLFGKKN